MKQFQPFGFMMRCLRAYAAPSPETISENSKSEELIKEIRMASEREPHYKLNLDTNDSALSSRRTSAARSPTSSIAENSKWEQIKVGKKKLTNVLFKYKIFNQFYYPKKLGEFK